MRTRAEPGQTSKRTDCVVRVRALVETAEAAESSAGRARARRPRAPRTTQKHSSPAQRPHALTLAAQQFSTCTGSLCASSLFDRNGNFNEKQISL